MEALAAWRPHDSRRPHRIRVDRQDDVSPGAWRSTITPSIVPEFVRGYAEKKNGVLSFSDHGPIAHGQMALEDKHIARAERLIIQDTDLLSTVVYCAHYFGQCPAWIATRRRSGVRISISSARSIFRGSPTACATAATCASRCSKLFVDAVVASGVPFARVTGVGDVRFEQSGGGYRRIAARERLAVFCRIAQLQHRDGHGEPQP